MTDKGDPRINGERLWADLMTLGEIGFALGRGVTRTALSQADIAGKEWLVGRFREAGLEVRTDTAYNVIGRLVSGTPGARLVAMGSHLDTVPQGGRLPTACWASWPRLECVRTIREQGIRLPWDLEVINFTDEDRWARRRGGESGVDPAGAGAAVLMQEGGGRS